MTLSTIDQSGRPDARMLILKDLDGAGWHFAVHAASRKGRDLATRPVAALTFYWPELVRQVRVRGPVIADASEVAAADFLARPEGSARRASNTSVCSRSARWPASGFRRRETVAGSQTVNRQLKDTRAMVDA